MTVIALSIDLGAVGQRFAKTLAQELGLRFIDTRRFETAMAEQSDRTDGAIRLPVSSHFRPDLWAMSGAQLAFRMKEQVLLEAVEGNVLIVGYCAPFLLRNSEHVIRIRVSAPCDYRERKVMSRRCYADARTAQLDIQTFSELMQGFVRRTFGAEWSTSKRYDLVLNTARIPPPECISMIEAAVDLLRFRDTEAARAALATELAILDRQELSMSPVNVAPRISPQIGRVSQGPSRR